MNRLPEALIATIRDLRRTKSVAEVRAILQIASHTILKYSNDIKREPCQCGRPGGHKGWCKTMLARSPRRQATVAAFIPKNKKWTEEAKRLVCLQWELGLAPEAICADVQALLGRTDISTHAIQVIAGKSGAKRPFGYLSSLRHKNMTSRWVRWRSNKEKWTETLAEEPTTAPPSPHHDMSQVQAVVEKRPPIVVAQVRSRQGFSMEAMRGPDPLTSVRLAQAAQASRGRL